MKYGDEGYKMLKNTISYIKSKNERTFLIADGKRNDIGNTAEKYAYAYLTPPLDFDAITINPLMGLDTIEPFLNFHDKWIIPLGLTSNQGAHDFLLEKTKNDEYFFEKIMKTLPKILLVKNDVRNKCHPTAFLTYQITLPEYFIPGIGTLG